MAKSELTIKIEDRKISLILRNPGKKDATISWTDENDMSKNLLVKLDELFKKNGIFAKDIEKFSVDSNLSDSYTSARIAQAVANTLEWTVKE